MVHLDTHVVVWLAERDFQQLSQPANTAIAQGPVRITPMVLLELQYLQDMGRTLLGPDEIVLILAGEIGLTISDTPFIAVANQARQVRWTRDPFDRMIVAAALADQANLVTKDRLIRTNLPSAVW